MDKNLSILIYEKEKDLNLILHQQILLTDDYEPHTAHNQTNLLELVNKIKFDICVLNVVDVNPIFKSFLDIILDKNKHLEIIGYGDKLVNTSVINNLKIILLEKPFRFRDLITKLDNIKLKIYESNKILLMKHIEFSPNKKTLFNINTKTRVHLTEKENYLLNYLYSKRNLELTKNNLLINIWGVKGVINTHTLETHIYRLKQKLYNLEPNLSFSLVNQNGLYSMKYL